MNGIGMKSRELAARAAELVSKGAKRPEIRAKCWGEARAIEHELQYMRRASKPENAIDPADVVVGQHVLVSMAQERRAKPDSEVRWYRAVVKEIHRKLRFTVFYCWIEFHADEQRIVAVRHVKPYAPTKMWDGVRGPQ